eukprot:TRINITY_DN1310_c0_g1_i6.p1 TRINITY_DN1310_c0_g1~~TRINITY_DN1310_c0_g1_i6.p1  ORF type:complete len:554 (-),score=202.68 TRINITY_DN1310_c0_g1_i6:179-1744(-)
MTKDSNDEFLEVYDEQESIHNKEEDVAVLGMLDALDFNKQIQVDDFVDGKFNFRKLMQFLGPGFLVSIAYIDPGNFDTDINAGGSFKYQLLWILLLATVMGCVVQFLASKLGLVTKKDLAQHCHECYSKPVHITLWLMAEIAVIASDIPEVLGTAYALYLLIGMPIPVGVVVTALDTLLFLFLQYLSIRILEVIIAILLGIISLCFFAEMFWSKPDYLEIAAGFVPFWGFGEHKADYISAGIGLVGAVIMPHNLFLHSALVQSRKIGKSDAAIKEAMIYNAVESGLALGVSFLINMAVVCTAAALFFYDPTVGLFEASDLLKQILGGFAPYLFAIALLASGQSSTITGTYAGQFIMEGFLDIKIAQWKRNMITRGIAILPSLAVAIWASTDTMDGIIKWSQVLLSIQLPFAVIPLLNLTSSYRVMGSFRNSWQLISVGWLISIFVIAANISLVVFSIAPFLNIETTLGIVLLVLLLVFSLFYMGFLIYLSRLDIDAISEKMKIETEPEQDQDKDLLSFEIN